MMHSVSRTCSIKWYNDRWKINWKEYGRKQSRPKWGTIPDAWRNWGNLLEMLPGLLAWKLVCELNKSQIQVYSITTTPACSHSLHMASQYVASNKQSFETWWNWPGYAKHLWHVFELLQTAFVFRCRQKQFTFQTLCCMFYMQWWRKNSNWLTYWCTWKYCSGSVINKV